MRRRVFGFFSFIPYVTRYDIIHIRELSLWQGAGFSMVDERRSGFVSSVCFLREFVEFRKCLVVFSQTEKYISSPVLS